MEQKDSRIRLMNEILNGIKVIKLYAWEDHFQEDVQNVRHKEISFIKKLAYLNIASGFSWMCVPFLVIIFSIISVMTLSFLFKVALATFGTFVATSDEPLTAERAFVALSLFNILQFPLAMFPHLISSIVQASVSLKRLSRFLQNDEIDPDNLETREQAASGMYCSDVNINDIIMTSQ